MGLHYSKLFFGSLQYYGTTFLIKHDGTTLQHHDLDSVLILLWVWSKFTASSQRVVSFTEASYHGAQEVKTTHHYHTFLREKKDLILSHPMTI